MEIQLKSPIAGIARFASWLVVTALLVCANRVQSQSTQTLTLAGLTPEKLGDGSAVLVGHYNPEQKLRLALAVQPPHMAEEEQFLQELTKKDSPNFHKFLTTTEWNARFAPSAEDEQKVVDWVQSQGLTVTHRYANRLLVDVEAPAGVIEKAFGVTMNSYKVGEEVDFANDRDPVIPSSLNGILYSVLGLNNIDRVHGKMKETRNAKGPDYVSGPAYVVGKSSQGDGDPTKDAAHVRAAHAAGQASPRPSFTNGYADPGDIFSSQAYNWDGLELFSHCCNVHNDSGGSPKETSIALATYAGFNGSDVNTFFQTYGFAWNWTPLAINGASGTPGTECDLLNSGCTGPAVDDEATLDLEYSTAASNSYGSSNATAHVYVYEGVNQDYDTITDLFNYMINDENARVMSTSWSGAETTSGNNYTYWEVPNHAIFNNMTGVGWTLIGDADDQGSTGNCSTISVNFPASDNNFVAAGGTELMLYSNGQWDYEVAWTGGTGSNACQSNDGGGGGGVSALWSQPYWQSDYADIHSLGSNRLEPDLALNAGGIGQNYYYNGTLSAVGGTSIVAPELAGFFAQENTYLNYVGSICGSDGNAACTPVGNPNPYMYYVGGSGGRKDPYYDITSGCTSNNVTIANGLTPWCAGTGFDLATGWGSANMMQLAWGINFELIPAYGAPGITFTGPAINTWYNTNQQVDWTVDDTDGQDVPAPGVAGFTQGWDSIPADPYSEPHGGSGNSFYSGPEYPFATSGCLALVAGSCSGGVSQGCHTVNVEAWDNQGATVTSTYGPICYDTVAPVATASLSGTTSITVTISATDASSGVSHIYYQLDGGATVTYSSAFTVSALGSHTVNYWAVDVAGNVESTQSISFTIGSLTLSATGLAYGSEAIGDSTASQTVTLTNTGNTTVSISSIVLGGTDPSDYAFGNSCASTLAAGANCTIHGHFAPTTSGSLPATIAITDNASGSPQTIALTGTGYVAGTVSLSATSLAFGSETVGDSTASQSVTLTNTGSSAVTISSIVLGGANPSDYDFANSCGTGLAAGANCTIHGHFGPTTSGSLPATITITDTATSSPQTIALSGTGTVLGTVSLSATSLAFGSETVGDSTASQSVTLTNTGSSTVTLSSIVLGGANPSDYAFANTCGATLAAGANCTIHGHFAPTTSGSLPATITITDTASGSPQTISLTGTGATLGTVSLSATSLAYGSETVGDSTASQSVTLTNTGSSTVTLSSIALGGANPSDYAFGNTCGATLAAGANCSIHGHFAPTTTGALPATITVTDSASGSPQTISLTGTGVGAD